MGADIYSYTGILATPEQVLKVITGKNKREVIEICQDTYDSIKQQAEEQKTEWYTKKLEFFSSLNAIPLNISLAKLKELLLSLVVVEGAPAKYDLDTHVKYDEDLADLWRPIFRLSATELPELQEINAWGSGRYNGWDVPHGEARFVFCESDCYEKRITPTGKRLQKLIGHCDVTEWTEYSV